MKSALKKAEGKKEMHAGRAQSIEVKLDLGKVSQQRKNYANWVGFL